MKLALINALEERKTQSLYRSRPMIEHLQGVHISHRGKTGISFCHNDYLGLAQDPKLTHAFKAGVDQYGVGSSASYLISGYRRAHQALEEIFCQWTGYPRALLFSNGYMANLGILTSLCKGQDRIYQDRYNHASLLDAGQMAKAPSQRYRHQDIESLKRLLEKPHLGHQFIVSDGVFSMHGDIAPLPELVDCAKKFQSTLIIDDAHGLGVLGSQGKGCMDFFGLTPREVSILVCPLGKAFGCYGAIVAANETIIDSLIQWARSYIYTTAPPPALVAAARASVELVIKESWRREQLQSSIQFFKQEARLRDLPLSPSWSAIQSLVIGDSQKALNLSEQLWESGFFVSALRPPTVTPAILRISLSALHTKEHISSLVKAMAKLLPNL